ncbi:MAG: hypothetical protein AB1349_10115 [Elusimicrobiota bacterium]
MMLCGKKLVVMLVGIMVSGLIQMSMAQQEEKSLELESDEIKDKGARSLFDALEGIPGVRVEQQCSYCNFSVLRI